MVVRLTGGGGNYPAISTSPSVNSGGNVDTSRPFQPSPNTSPGLPTGTRNLYNQDPSLAQFNVFDSVQKISPEDIRIGKPISQQYSYNGIYSSAESKQRQMAALAASNPAAFFALQKQLFFSGFYGSKMPRFGFYTSDDIDAMNNALGSYQALTASGVPVRWQDYLDRGMMMGLKNGWGSGGGFGGGGGRAPLVISYTDPAELHTALQNAAQAALVRNLNSAELDTFVKAFHGKEAAAQRGAYNGNSSVTNPEVTGEAAQQLDTQHSAEEQQRSKAMYLDAIQSLLGVK